MSRLQLAFLCAILVLAGSFQAMAGPGKAPWGLCKKDPICVVTGGYLFVDWRKWDGPRGKGADERREKDAERHDGFEVKHLFRWSIFSLIPGWP
jgi:hypothetical protein